MLKIRPLRPLLMTSAMLWCLGLPVAGDEGCATDPPVLMNRAIFGITFSTTPQGLLIGGVSQGSAAARAGLQRGDTVVVINGFSPIFSDSLAALRWADELPAGRATVMEVIREDERFTVSLVGRPPTCAEAQRLAKRLAGGPPTAGTEPCNQLEGGECRAEESRPRTGGNIISAAFVELVSLAADNGRLQFRIAGPAGGYDVEIVEPAGLSTEISLADLPMRFQRTADQLRGGDYVLYEIKTYPLGATGKTRSRYSASLIEAPDYVR